MSDVRIIGGGLRGGPGKKSGLGISWTTSERSASTSGRLQSRTRGNGAGRLNKRRNVSRRNRPLQRSMPERDGKDIREDSLNQAGSCWFARLN